jgi:hypothetical protein
MATLMLVLAIAASSGEERPQLELTPGLDIGTHWSRNLVESAIVDAGPSFFARFHLHELPLLRSRNMIFALAAFICSANWQLELAEQVNGAGSTFVGRDFAFVLAPGAALKW